MNQYQIPKIFLPGFKVLLKLEEKDFKKVVNFLTKIPIGIGPKTFFTSLRKEIDISDAKDLSSTLYSLGGLLISDIKNFKKLAEDLSLDFKEQSNTKLTSKMLDKFKMRLEKLFANGVNLKLTYKALSLCNENDKTYQDGRIITDIRLIFNNDLKNIKRDAIVIHQLKIETEKNETLNALYFALDSNDLLKLKEQIERAIEKEKQIKDSYRKTINFIELTD